MIDEIFSISDDIRYVAVCREGKLASQRGNIDCGGMDYLIVRYGNFFQFVLPTDWGHVSVCIEKTADPVAIGERIKRRVREVEPSGDGNRVVTQMRSEP
jgi:hypothetical protein